MASDYGYNFGFRRSDSEIRTAEGGYKTPASGTLLIGTAVEIDFAAADNRLKQSAAQASLRHGVSGVLLQELQQFPSIYDPQVIDSTALGVAKPNQLSVITSGTGMKVWFKNTASVTRFDGKVIPAVNIVSLTGVAKGDTLGWNGTLWVKTTVAAEVWFRVLDFSTAGAGSVEAVMI